MPGIFVERRGDDLLQIKAPYYLPYQKRIRAIDGARWGGDDDKFWTIPIESAQDLDDEFFGELIYVTPRHEILEIDPPRPPKIFKRIKPTPIADIKTKPYPFQLFGANFLVHSMKEQRIAILGDLMGTGKTAMSIMSAMQLKQEGMVNKVIVVVLAPLRAQWAQEIAKFTNEKSVIFAEFRQKVSMAGGKRTILETIDQQKAKFIKDFVKSDTMFMVMSYQAVQQNEKLLERANFDMAIFDEAHFMNNKLSKTNKQATMLIQKRTKRNRLGFNRGIEFVVYSTGTPVTNYPEQIFGIVRTGNADIFGNWRDFRDEYCELDDYKEIIGYRKLDKLRRKTQNIMIRRTDKEIDLSLPPMIENDIYVDPHPLQKKADADLLKYQKDMIDARTNLLRQGKKGEARALNDKMKSILSQRRIASNHPNLYQMSPNEKARERNEKYFFKNVYDVPKFERCMELIEEIVDGGHKVVIFTESRRMTKLMHKEIMKFTKGVRYIGGLSDKERERRKKLFNEDPRCRVMIANKAGSTGLNLQSGRYLINYDLPDTPAEWEQRKYRIRRLDSKHDRIYIINLINKGMVDEQILVKLKDKQAAFDFVVENDKAQTEMHQKITGKNKSKSKTTKRKRVDQDEEAIVWT